MTTTYAEQAAELRAESERAFRRGDRLIDEGKDSAAVRAWQEGRRIAAQAQQYERLALSGD